MSLSVKHTKEGKKVKFQAQTVFLRDQLLEVTVKTWTLLVSKHIMTNVTISHFLKFFISNWKFLKLKRVIRNFAQLKPTYFISPIKSKRTWMTKRYLWSSFWTCVWRIGESNLRATCLKASFNNGAKLIVSLNCTRWLWVYHTVPSMGQFYLLLRQWVMWTTIKLMFTNLFNIW